MTPSGLWYVVAGVLAVVGIIGGVALIISSIVTYTDRIDNFARVDIPGSSTVQLDGTGGYSVYYEHEFASERFNSSSVDVEITAPDGSPVDLERYSSEVTYTSGDHSGRALYSFQADEPGAYQVNVNGNGGILAIGRGVGRGLAGGIVGGIAVGFLCVVAALVIVIVVALKRGKSKRRLAPTPAPPPPPPGWRYPPGAPPPPAPRSSPPPSPPAG